MAVTLLRHALYCTIDGVPTRVYAADGQHDVDRPTATASVTLPAPIPAHLDLNVPIELQAGYRDGTIRTVFSGRISDTREAFSSRSALVTIHAAGWTSLLDWEQETDLIFAGPISLYEIVRSLCAWRGVPSYVVDQIMAPDGVTPITLGGVPEHEGGNVIIPRRSSPLDWLRRKLALFGYRIFDTPSGTVRVQRVSGAPNTAPAATYTTGVNLYRLDRTRDVRTMTTYITVTGPSYPDADGVTTIPRSIAETVPYSAYLNPPGYRAGDIKDDVLVTTQLADIVRNVAEIDGGTPTVAEVWETRGDPLRAPGEVVTVTSTDHLGHTADYWVTGTDWRCDEGSYTTTLTGWAGGGEALPAGIDSEEIMVREAPLHVGDEDVAWYAQPVAQGKELRFTITVPDTYTAIAYEMWIHGSNSQMIDGGNADLTISKIEAWQDQGQEDQDRPIGTADLPIVPENYAQRLPYSDLYTHWQRSRGPIPGRLEKGTATIVVKSGENKDLPASTKWDDFEVALFKIILYGVGVPALPTPRSLT